MKDSDYGPVREFLKLTPSSKLLNIFNKRPLRVASHATNCEAIEIRGTPITVLSCRQPPFSRDILHKTSSNRRDYAVPNNYARATGSDHPAVNRWSSDGNIHRVDWVSSSICGQRPRPAGTSAAALAEELWPS
ncbi:hypothetical protein J6590_015753 [Homalodisca vitripennis]|nr:hypothetical protein J6590_015753 [Homalodisca vitripennis]